MTWVRFIQPLALMLLGDASLRCFFMKQYNFIRLLFFPWNNWISSELFNTACLYCSLYYAEFDPCYYWDREDNSSRALDSTGRLSLSDWGICRVECKRNVTAKGSCICLITFYASMLHCEFIFASSFWTFSFWLLSAIYLHNCIYCLLESDAVL